ncbi:MAG: ketol-acid reductoisomerase, partial [Candidatus Omnitrophica bacterium]|nr:ketol-acid reductoisomerase [Candidatus Omnitrophota bacterium]
EIQSGRFAKEFLATYKDKAKFEKLRRADDKILVETAGAKLRGMMKWL